jgi:Ala-tRNA(Pro) deacylase
MGRKLAPHRNLVLVSPYIRYSPFAPLYPHPTSPMATTTPDDLFAFLDRLGIAHRTVSHPPLFTVEESQALRGQIPGGHTKNLFLKDKKGALYLVSALEDAEIELKSLHRRLGASGRFSFGSADQLREALGVEPGAVTPLAAMNDTGNLVTVVLDQALMAHKVINCHPLRNTMTTSLVRDDLVKFLEATGHPPRIEAVAEPPAS